MVTPSVPYLKLVKLDASVGYALGNWYREYEYGHGATTAAVDLGR